VSPTPRSGTDGQLSRRRWDIQGLRAVAILLVVLYHGGFHVRGGFSGVDVFFVISGFVITGTLLRELESTGTLSLRAFYARRVRRLLPALALMLAVVTLVGILLTPIAGMRITSLTGVFASIFGANVYLSGLGAGYFDVSTSLDSLLHTWTLGVEEQFYLVFPGVLLVSWVTARRLRVGSRAASVLAIATVAVASGVLAVLLSRGRVGGGHGVQYAFYLSPPRAWEFGAGALLALCVPLVRRLPTPGAWVLGLAGTAAIVAGAAELTSTDASPLRMATFPVFGACALLAAGTTAASGPSRVLAVQPLPWIGDLSYSWYLWHWPAIVYAKALWPHSSAAAPIAAALSLLPSWASFRFVENPIRARRDAIGRTAAALAGACVGIGVVASTIMLGAHGLLQHTSSVKSWNRSQIEHLDETRGCDSPVPLDRRHGFDCTWRVAHAKGSVVLVGDSNAGHFSEPVVTAANSLGYDATLVTLGGCPFIELVVEPLGGTDACFHWYLATSAALVRIRPNLVIIASRSDQYAYEDGVGTPGHPLSRSTPTRLALWKEGLTATLRTFAAADIPTIVVEPVPSLPAPQGDCAVVRILTASCAGSEPRTQVDAELGPIVRVERRSVASASHSISVDFENALCSSRCSAMRGHLTLYRNALHLSVDGAKTLTPEFRGVIARMARPG